MIGEGNTYTKKNKGNNVVVQGSTVVDFEQNKVHWPKFFHRGKPLLAKESALKSPSVADSLLSHFILLFDEQEMENMIEVSMRN